MEVQKIAFLETYCVDEYDDDTSPKKLGKGLTEYVLRTGKSALVDKKLDEKLMQIGETELVGEQSEIWLGVPLKIQNKVIGVMVVQDYEDPSTYGVTEQQILDVVGYPISRAIERKMVEAEREELIVQLKELNESKDKLFSLISHDLRNPFNSLLGFADILTTEYDTLTKEEIKEYLIVINESSKNLYGMANNLLHYSRYQLGKYRYKPAFTNLSETVSNFFSTNKRIIKSKDLLFKNNIDKELSAYIDEDIFNVVLDNIIGNAIKFTPPEGTIKVETKEGEQVNTLKLIIADNGTGITKLNMQRIEKREMFSNPGTMREYGTGLGLSLSRDFMELNKGTLQIESEEGNGATFWFTSKFEANEQNLYLSTPDGLKGSRILIVDDNDTTRNILLQQLRSVEVLVEEANSGERGLELLKTAAKNNEPFEVAVIAQYVFGRQMFDLGSRPC